MKRKLCSVLIGSSLLAAAALTPARAADGGPLIVVNPGFEKGTEGWTFSPGTGVATNRPHGGSRLVYLDAGPGMSVSQAVTAPAAGRYSISAWISTGGPGGTFAVRRNGADAGTVALPSRTVYARYTVSDVELAAGDRLEIVFGSGSGWVNVDDVMVSPGSAGGPRVTSSNAEIVEMFAWSRDKARSWVHQDGVPGPLNVDERRPGGTGEGAYAATYWAGYAHRTGYYSRDFAHQLAGAHVLGLDRENKTMLRSFAASATEQHKYYPVWALNFDATTYLDIDYRSPASFVREVPATFELVEKANQAFRWTGDRAYLDDAAFWDYYRHATGEFVDLHDGLLPNGPAKVAEGTGKGIFAGSASYNETGDEPLAEAGDAIAAQYQAYRALAELARDKHDPATARRAAEQARTLKSYFNRTWSVKPGSGEMVRAYTVDGTPLTGFGKENSWFMPMKGIIDAGPRNEAYLDFIDAQASGAGRPANIEAVTYLPDTFFRHNRDDTAWKWMRYVYEQRDAAHVSGRQGLNGDYPEVSFTLVAQTVEGLMGIQPDAPRHTVATQSRLPSDIGWLEVADVPVGDGTVTVRHDGRTATTFTNGSARPYLWEARFLGEHRWLTVNGHTVAGLPRTIDGVRYTVALVPVAGGRTATARVTG
ncbi:hypothetical protein GCM10010149_71150 [Nonomuraea roseoviolacea subsp. roseoviolacea]|uniref:CBM35 domain-containing protein n=1 Tax=Nonomuraea roseoviolacea TaxID=103837 RepID=UPI0031CE288D